MSIRNYYGNDYQPCLPTMGRYTERAIICDALTAYIEMLNKKEGKK